MTPIAKYTIVGIAAFLAGYAIRPTPPEVKNPTQENLPKESSTAIISDPMIDNLDTASFAEEAASSHIAPNLKRNEEAFALREFLLGDFKSDGG